jgi:hypothetical protein
MQCSLRLKALEQTLHTCFLFPVEFSLSSFGKTMVEVPMRVMAAKVRYQVLFPQCKEKDLTSAN